MRDVLPTLLAWAEEGHRFATATVTQTWGSSPRPLGSVMGVREDGLICGSVSGGCVEGTVIEEAKTAMVYGGAREMTFAGLSEASVWEVGLSCGGKIQVWIEPCPDTLNPPAWQALVDGFSQDRPFVVASGLQPHERAIWSPGDEVRSALDEAAHEAYGRRASAEVEVEGKRYFLNVVTHRERLLIVGAVHIAVPLVKFARELGFETVVIDPRGQFTNEERFPDAPDRMIAEWPQKALSELGLNEETYAVVLTHDPKIDDVALAELLRSPAPYIGALGSRVTQAKRREDLLAQGFTEDDLKRIHGPIGLDIGARSPEEIAVSIMAEIVQVRRRP